jgi:hypothetical protein
MLVKPTPDEGQPVVTIQMKIQKAREVFEQYGEILQSNPGVVRLLDELESHWKSSWQVMEETGIVASCSHCEEEEGGSCCGRGIENKYNETLLLLNLIYGVSLPDERLRSDSCFFLGDSGCRLKIRQVICVNYLCTAIQKRLSHEDLVRVQQTVGFELDSVFLLHETVKRILKACNGNASS